MLEIQIEMQDNIIVKIDELFYRLTLILCNWIASEDRFVELVAPHLICMHIGLLYESSII